jgi:protein-S-isoprenylcysteine O-methyltransferase Ste14
LSARDTLRRLRIPLGFALGIAYVVFAPRVVTPLTLAVGAAIAFAGLLVRGWAAGHIVKNDRLATTGPYAHTRNPLYFGSFLIAAGFAIAAHWSLLLLVIAFWVLVYGPTIERERANVSGRFPDAYAEWSRNVPAFVPRPTPWRGPAADEAAAPFSFGLYMRHKEWQAGLVYVLVVAWLAYGVVRTRG